MDNENNENTTSANTTANENAQTESDHKNDKQAKTEELSKPNEEAATKTENAESEIEITELENAIKVVVDNSELNSLTFNKILEKLSKQFASQQSVIEENKDALRRFVKSYIAERTKENVHF